MKISLTDFVDFSIRSGPPKVTKVREIKNRPEYEPALDLWKPLRDAIVELPQSGKSPKVALDKVIADQTHALKLRLYPGAVDGFLTFLGRRPPEWIKPVRGVWKSGDLEVGVNPEIGLKLGGKPTLIKLYFKSEELTKAKVQATIGVIVAELGVKAAPDTQFGVLDVKAGKLQLADRRWTATDTQILIRAEALSFVEMWTAV